jgi:ATP-dependent protease Clp ATPase subunit
MEKKTVFKGVATALITPLDESGINYEKFGALIEDQVKRGVNALVICGTTGEASTLNDKDHIGAIAYATEKVGGRIPVIATLEPLDKDALVRILKEPKNALLKQYQKLFAFDGVELEFTEEALRAIAKKAHDTKTGARGLRSITEKIMTTYMYQIPSDPSVKALKITEQDVLA